VSLLSPVQAIAQDVADTLGIEGERTRESTYVLTAQRI
jgi:hypothetical protein